MNVTYAAYVALAFLVAFLITFLATPFVISLSYKIGALDSPIDTRKIHKNPIPRIGGLAILYGFLVSTLCFSILDNGTLAILGGSIVIVLLGIFDDLKQISALKKLCFQIIAASIPVAFGVKIDHLSIPIPFWKEIFVSFNQTISFGATVFWIVGITNTINLIDGLDGLAVGLSSIASLSLLVISFFASKFNLSILTAAIAGASFGFLPFNTNPAKIFMGDSGSTFLGFLLACSSIEGLFKTQVVVSFLLPLLILAVPIFDTSFAIIRRIVHKKPIMLPDRNHLHHRLIDAGFSQKEAVGVLYSASAALSLTAVVVLLKGMARGIVLVISVAFLLIIGTRNNFKLLADIIKIKTKYEKDTKTENKFIHETKLENQI